MVHAATGRQRPGGEADPEVERCLDCGNTQWQPGGGTSARALAPQVLRPDWDEVEAVLNGNASLGTLSKDCPD
ncbi:hypothetical protein ACFOET_17850 [Parapedobacter deserti]|uniref:Uncharacterized protein n=1 Tax=Parapedobacter deserti TaxID=1912957 RepID=A0ABV7JTQ0_9SPHI